MPNNAKEEEVKSRPSTDQQEIGSEQVAADNSEDPRAVRHDRAYIYHNFTNSLCPTCLKVVQAKVILQHGKVYMLKTCPEHGSVRTLLSSDAAYYLSQGQYNKPGTIPRHFQMPVEKGCPLDCGLCTDHEQHTCLALIEITEACNLRCPTCFADSDIGRFSPVEEVERMLDTVVENEGYADVVQLSGGEPTIHPHILDILSIAKKKRIKALMINTNGVRIARDEEFVRRLSDFKGNFEVYLQFDGFRQSTFEELRGEDLRAVKERAIANLTKYEIPINLTATIKRGVNEDEIGEIVKFGVEQKMVRGVTFQPITNVGRHGDFNPLDRTTVPDVIQAIDAQTNGMFRTGDFVPLPCHSDCISMTYAYVKGEKVKPLPRYLDVKRYLDVIGNQITFEVDDMKGVVGEALTRLWSASMPLSTVNALRDFTCCLPVAPRALSQREHGSVLYENMFRIVIIAFMDAWNFDVRSAKKCCVHHILPDGKIIPFCSYNTLHRPKYMVKKRVPISAHAGSSPI
jgi:7,8-dihydro-6-hydroxymethylpterin dimethyltransferase